MRLCKANVSTACQPEELSCKATVTVEGVEKQQYKCYNTTKDICKAGGFNALCDDHEDVQHCRKFLHTS